jgi:hypothetical protein
VRVWAPVSVLCVLLGACSASPMRIESHALQGVPAQSADRLIIAAVENDPAAFLASAGSTPRGYDSVAAYGPTSRAREVMHSLEKDYDLREVSNWPIEPLHMHCAVLRIPDDADRAMLLTKISNDPRVKLAQPLQTFSTRTGPYNDPYVELQRGFQQMDVVDAHAWTLGDGVKVGIIDTGVDTEHPDLRGRIAAAQNFVDSDEVQFRRDRHGTEMAGVIAAVANNHQGIVGVAPSARVLVFKACWQLRVDADAASCNSFTLARALVAALDAHVQVVNLSLNGPEDPLLVDLIREGLRRGVLFVGAAASVPSLEGAREGLMHQPGIIEVAGTETGTSRDSVFHAPGKEILTLLPGGHYDFASGNSIATAQVTGVVALLLARKPDLTAAAASKLLRETSSNPQALAEGADQVDACAAVTALIGRGSCQPAVRVGRGSGGPQSERVALH